MRSLTRVFALIALCLTPCFAMGDIITEIRTNTEDIEIPVFNQSLGTLNSVTLSVTMQGGVTNTSGNHNHAPQTLVSNNSESGSGSGGFAPFTINSSTAPTHTHGYVTPNYSGNGLTLGSFAGSTSASGAHSHSVLVSPNGTVSDGLFAYRLRITVSPQNFGAHTHSYASNLQNYVFNTPTEMLPFLSASDFSIVDGLVTTNSGGLHNHTMNSFSVNSNGDSFQFSPVLFSSGGAHNHAFDPRWTVRATFDFTPAAIPEPSAGIVMVIGLLAAVRSRRRTC